MAKTMQAAAEPPRNGGGQPTFEQLMQDYQDALAAAQELPCPESRRWLSEAQEALRNCPAVRRVRGDDRRSNSPSPGRW